MDKERLAKNLTDAGCPAASIDRILKRYDGGNSKDVLSLLKKERCRAMEEYHESGRKVDCMDFILRQIEKEKAEEQK